LEITTIDISDKLVEKARSGDQQAIFRLYKMYLSAMYNTCIRIVVNRTDAEDIIQESFISAFSNINEFRGDSSFGAWLKRIVINKSLNHLRTKKVLYVNIDDMLIEETDTDDEDIPNIPVEAVHEGIKSLPEKARVILSLYLLEGYLHREIASMLGISESTSRTQYTRAKRLLRDILIAQNVRILNK
jgi:RNA polymerase sigma factor (sigma-70 family)